MKTCRFISMSGLCVIMVQLAASVTPANAFCIRDSSLTPGFTNGVVYAIATQSDGKVIVGGSFTYNVGGYYGTTYKNIVRFNTNNTADSSFNPSPNSTVTCILVQPDQKVIIGGSFTTVAGMNQYHLSRLTTNGSPDYVNFNPPQPNNYVLALGRQSDGKVIIGGLFSTLGGVAQTYIARLNTNGTHDTNFNPGITGSSPYVASLAVYPSGVPTADEVIIGGNFNSVGSYSRYNVARLNAGGSVDTSFSTGADTLSAPVYAVATDYGPFSPNGTDMVEVVLIGGAFTDFGGSTRDYWARLTNDGGVDNDVVHSLVDGEVTAISILSDHSILMGGAFTYISNASYPRGGVARFNPYLDLISPDTSWADCGADGGANDGSVEAIAVSATGEIYVGGSFTEFEGESQKKVVRVFAE